MFFPDAGGITQQSITVTVLFGGDEIIDSVPNELRDRGVIEPAIMIEPPATELRVLLVACRFWDSGSCPLSSNGC